MRCDARKLLNRFSSFENADVAGVTAKLLERFSSFSSMVRIPWGYWGLTCWRDSAGSAGLPPTFKTKLLLNAPPRGSSSSSMRSTAARVEPDDVSQGEDGRRGQETGR